MSRELSDPIDDAALRRLRAYRLDRVRQVLESNGLGAVVLFDPSNIRYATGTRNMAVWTLHNHVRCAFVPAQGLPVLFEFGGGRWPVEAETLETVGEVRPAGGWTHYGIAHGVGLKDEYPVLPNREDLDRLSDPDQVIEPGMVFSLESYIGAVGGKEGVNLEDQILITEDGPELLSGFPFEDRMLT